VLTEHEMDMKSLSMRYIWYDM